MGKIHIISELIDQHEEKVNRVDSCGRTALQYAVQMGRLAAVQLLLAKRAKVNTIDKFSTSPITEYELLSRLEDVKSAYPEIMKLLILHGAHFNLNCLKKIKIEEAIYNFLCGKSHNLPDKKIAAYLLETGVDINKEIFLHPNLNLWRPNTSAPLEQIIIRRGLVPHYKDLIVETLELISLYLAHGAILKFRQINEVVFNKSVFNDLCMTMSSVEACKNQKTQELLELTLNNFIEAGAVFTFIRDELRIPDIGILKFLYHRGMPFDDFNLQECIGKNSNFNEFKNTGTRIHGYYYNNNFLYSLANSVYLLPMLLPQVLAQLTLEYLNDPDDPKEFALIVAAAQKNRRNYINRIYHQFELQGHLDYFKSVYRILVNSYLLTPSLLEQFITNWAVAQAKNKHSDSNFEIIINTIFNFVNEHQKKILMQIYLRLCASNYSNTLTLFGLSDPQHIILDDFVRLIRLHNNSCNLNLSDKAVESLRFLEPSELYGWIKDNLNGAKVTDINLKIEMSYPDLYRWLKIICDNANNIFNNVKSSSVPQEKIKHTIPADLLEFENDNPKSQEIEPQEAFPSTYSPAQPAATIGSAYDGSRENYTDHPLYESGYRFHYFSKPKDTKPRLTPQSTSYQQNNIDSKHIHSR